MRPRDRNRVRELLRRLDEIERQDPSPHESAIRAIARDAIVDELARLSRESWLRVDRRGDGLEAVSLSG